MCTCNMYEFTVYFVTTPTIKQREFTGQHKFDKCGHFGCAGVQNAHAHFQPHEKVLFAMQFIVNSVGPELLKIHIAYISTVKDICILYMLSFDIHMLLCFIHIFCTAVAGTAILKICENWLDIAATYNVYEV